MCPPIGRLTLPSGRFNALGERIDLGSMNPDEKNMYVYHEKLTVEENWLGFSNCVEAEQQPIRRGLWLVAVGGGAYPPQRHVQDIASSNANHSRRFLYSSTLKSRSSQGCGRSGSAILPACSGEIFHKSLSLQSYITSKHI